MSLFDVPNVGRRGKALLVVLCICLVGCVGSQNRPLQLVSGSGPAYPSKARELGLEGHVVVRYDVMETGAVRNAQVVSSKPAGIFDAAAVRAVTSWVFQPVLVDDQPQAQEGLHSTVTFKVGTGSEYADY